MAISPRIPDGFSEISTWLFDDVVAANELIDALEAGEIEAKRKAKIAARIAAKKKP